jgi:hypothetical protein
VSEYKATAEGLKARGVLTEEQAADITATRDALRDWVHAHPELVDPTL